MTSATLDRLERREARVVVVGQGYVGLPLALHAVRAGFTVVGFELDAAKVARLAAADSYIEDVTDEDLAAALASGYRPSRDEADLVGFDVAVITVPTPLREGLPDLTHIESAARALGGALRPGALVVLESTTYPGTTEELVVPLLESASGLVVGDFLVGYSPERIDPGNPRYGLANTPKVVSGVDAESLAAVEAFYGAFIEKLVPVSSPAEAELTKIIENTFRHVNVALVNELAMFANDLGVDIWNALDAAASKPFGYLPFRPGPGVGGHCLPVDPSYLAWRVKRRLGETFRFIELANDVNDHMPSYVVRRVQSMLNRESLAVKGAKVLLLGLAYKPSTGDARESPSLAVLDRLIELGAVVSACDPHVRDVRLHPSVEMVDFGAEALQAADVVILLTDHPEFDYDVVVRNATRVFDTRDRLRPFGAAHVERL